MFSKRTLFIVGAGASQEVGLPVGSALATAIAKMFNYRTDFARVVEGDGAFIQSLANEFHTQSEWEKYEAAGRHIASGVQLVGSIDNYVDTHRHNPCVAHMGKSAIVYSILRAEAASSLTIDKSQRSDATMNFDKLRPSWFYQFGSMLVEGMALEDIGALFRNINIICFNYDRCIEHFLTNWLSAVYRIPVETAVLEVAKLLVLRPYGTVGPYQGCHPGPPVQYGADPTRSNVPALRNGIKTYTEQIEDAALLTSLTNQVSEAELIVFLGFGFHPQNMKLLTPSTPIKTKRIIASAYETSDANKRSIESLLANLGPKARAKNNNRPVVTIDPNMCGKVLADNRRDILAHDLN